MFRVKICGITREADARHAADQAGVDAIGLNFYEKSSRSIGAEQAAALSKTGVWAVGVFVNASAEVIRRVVERVQLDAIQLHGDEPTSLLAELPTGVPVVRAVRMGAEGLAPVAATLAEADRAGRPYAAVLVDAAVPKLKDGSTVYGGSGHTTDWERVRRERELLGETPLILAGGLTAENVAEAIAVAQPDGVDTASGVESAPGVKAAELVTRFAEAADLAFRRLGR